LATGSALTQEQCNGNSLYTRINVLAMEFQFWKAEFYRG